MASPWILDGQNLKVSTLIAMAFRRASLPVEIPAECLRQVERSHHGLLKLLEARTPIYGVTTGFGDSGNRTISGHQSEQLQENLVAYLLCGTGPRLAPEAARAILTVRLNSMCRGLSGVSSELIERMRFFLENDWLPVIPREGSLGASGDLVPLAYLAQMIQGQGQVYIESQTEGQIRPTAEVLAEAGVAGYTLKAKEGLALVNGTSAMAGLFAVNLNHARFLLDWLCLNSSWLTLALQGRVEAFGPLVNEKAKTSPGQSWVAARVRGYLEDESYRPKPLGQIHVEDSRTRDWVQDRYSLRCVPQIAGPIFETLNMLEGWLEREINSASDNPLIGEGDELANGGNFYGGYMSQGMDYLKISLAHLADVVDRQVAYIVDDKSNRGLPANLANWQGLPEHERHLHHGLKGLHQSVSAITSEIMARATPGGIFSRSSESHNQDKVSLGMSAAVQCGDMLEPLFTIMSMHTAILAQALDLRGVKLSGARAVKLYAIVRTEFPFVAKDQPLGESIDRLRTRFKEMAASDGRLGER